jgi:uncharacterized protein YjbI with pentapeptide repeats
MDADINNEIWHRLVAGESLDGLGLAFVNGRVDLRGLVIPAPTISGEYRTDVADAVELRGYSELHGIHWEGLDFTGARMDIVRFLDCTMTDCVFDKARCRDWRLWRTTVTDCTFRSTDLRQSFLGAASGSRRDVFRKVVFDGTDMRGTVYTSAEFDHCVFKNARLDKVDFEGSSFSYCSFEGELREVMFYRKAFPAEDLPVNEMDHVDFTKAKLRSVEFRDLELNTVHFPEDEDHIILDHYPRILDRLLERLTRRSDPISRRFIAYLTVTRKWAAPNQRRGILNRQDIIEIFGSEESDRFFELITECEREQNRLAGMH